MVGTVAPGGEFELAVDAFNIDPSNETAVVDQAFSPDGKTLYVAASDGTISAFDMATREETAHWKVGQQLGGISITPDGKTLLAIERPQPSEPGVATEGVYTVDLKTGATHENVAYFGAEGQFSDVVATADGRAIISDGNGLASLDLAHDTFSALIGSSRGDSLSTSGDRKMIIAADTVDNNAPLSVYKLGHGQVAEHQVTEGAAAGSHGAGVQAISTKSGIIAQGVYYDVYIYDTSLHYKFDLFTYKNMDFGVVGGLDFSPDGKILYVLDEFNHDVVSLSTTTWNQLATWSVPEATVTGDAPYQNKLVVSSDGRYVSVAVPDGVKVLQVTSHVSGHAGSTGANGLVGGSGNDTFTINNAGDHITEAMGAGYDDAVASVNYTLEANVERLDLVDAATRGDGNNLANTIIGNDLANLLYGHGGNDALDGGAGNDHLVGGAGNDLLDGGSGADVMDGGTGNDRFTVNSSGDVVLERPGEGTDTVWSSVHYTLPDNVENLVLTGGAVTGTGNALGNTITGSLLGDRLSGLAGDDVLIAGGGGSDVLSGGAGADRFTFVQNDASGASWRSADRITDFSHADGDKIDLKAMDANPGKSGDQAFSFIGSHAFDGHAGELHFVQSGGNTYVEGDLDGDKLTDFAIRLDGHLTLAASDFVL